MASNIIVDEQTALESATTTAVEQWGMMLADPFDGSLGDLLRQQDAMCVTITLSEDGEARGTVGAFCPQAFARTLYQNLMGCETTESSANDEILDTLKEFVNILGGHFASECYGVDAKIALHPPKLTSEGTEILVDVFEHEPHIALLGDDQPLVCFVTHNREL